MDGYTDKPVQYFPWEKEHPSILYIVNMPASRRWTCKLRSQQPIMRIALPKLFYSLVFLCLTLSYDPHEAETACGEQQSIATKGKWFNRAMQVPGYRMSKVRAFLIASLPD